jgi:ketosteroid isomerase-like protein
MRVPVFAAAGVALTLACAGAVDASMPSSARIAQTIKADMAQIVAGINAHDVARATAFDAPDIVSMESGRPPSTGLAAERQGLGMAMQYNPSWRISMIDETVDVARAGDMAIYRGAYQEDSTANGTPMTHLVNFIAGFKKQRDRSWKVEWSVVCAQERSHPVDPAATASPH